MVFLLALGSGTASKTRPYYLLRAVDASMSMLPTPGPINLTNHICVSTDGRFYVWLQRQEIIGGTSTVEVFKGSLNDREMQILRTLLDQVAIKNAPHFENPKPPVGVEEFQLFEARIDRGSAVQRVGYFKYTGHEPESTDSTKQQWRDSEVALQPLLGWVRALKSDKYPLKQPVSQSAQFSCYFED